MFVHCKTVFQNSSVVFHDVKKLYLLAFTEFYTVSKVLLLPTYTRDLFKPRGKLLKKGDLLRRPHLAKVLQLIANNGSAEPFYNGPMSKVLVNDVKAAGGIMTLDDLRNYKVNFKRALKSKLGDKTLITCPPPTSGPVLTLILNILRGECRGRLAVNN